MTDTKPENVNENVNENVMELAKNIHHGELNDSYNIVVTTISAFKEIINNTEWNTAKDLMSIIIQNGKYLIKNCPLEACIGNMVRRILQIIREEYTSELRNKTDETDPQESLHKILTAESDQQIDFNIPVPSLKSAVNEHISEFETELETCSDNIIQQASEHIHSNEIVMTIGKSKLVEEFFKKAATTRPFEVIVAEGGPLLTGHEMALNLTRAKIKTTLISDAAIFAMMSRVNKVIIGTNSVMANGGLRSISGSHTVAQAAKHYSVPVMVLLPLFKLSPLYLCSYKQDSFNKYISPFRGVIEANNAQLLEKIEAYNPMFDYVPPDLVTLFITNTGGNAPSYVYRLLSELYHPDDYEL
ncbi:PREDICTED: translation initiation factor eIF-2B subunit beta [Dinoponera quadriceps]|uniref:Translation initiation factor eIF2B subunit beta n=1 Tax=Dinoponera quadriceps TaxID=609295 RepID=A0A6P3XMT3_DINQU|nr:PREDICTED: translation initiation factor eIF-2B subunit beta [Dinoponera quadriceps]